MAKSKHLNASRRSSTPSARRGRTWPTPRPFVKWVGGKGKLIETLVPMLGGGSGRFHEPFVGGGAVFFALARQGLLPAGGALLSDGNLRLVRTWRAIRDDLDGVIARLEDHAARHCKDHYYKVRALAVDDMAADADVAGWFIYLNKTGFNGLYRVNRKGCFNVPMGRYKNPTIVDRANLVAVNAVLQDVEIVHQDFAHALAAAKPADTVYLDPPYVPLSSTAWFAHYTELGFGPDDQRRLAEQAMELKQAGLRIVLSNHDTDEVRALYPPPFQHRVVQVARSVNRDPTKRGGVAELIIS